MNVEAKNISLCLGEHKFYRNIAICYASIKYANTAIKGPIDSTAVKGVTIGEKNLF